MTASKGIHWNRDSDARSFGSVVIAIVLGKDVAEIEYTVSYSGDLAYHLGSLSDLSAADRCSFRYILVKKTSVQNDQASWAEQTVHTMDITAVHKNLY